MLVIGISGTELASHERDWLQHDACAGVILFTRNFASKAQVAELTQAVQEATGEKIKTAFVDQGYTGQEPAAAAAAHGVHLEVVKLAEAKRGFVLLPKRWVVERSFGWAARFRRLSRDYERLASTLSGTHWLAFVGLMLANIFR